MMPICIYFTYTDVIIFLSAVISPTEFEVGDTSGVEFLPYKHGGIARQIKVPKIATFVSHSVLDYDTDDLGV